MLARRFKVVVLLSDLGRNVHGSGELTIFSACFIIIDKAIQSYKLEPREQERLRLTMS
jgi:hypothetical protein